MTIRRQQIKYIKTTYSHWMVDHWICKQVQADQIKSSSRRRKFTSNNKHFFNLLKTDRNHLLNTTRRGGEGEDEDTTMFESTSVEYKFKCRKSTDYKSNTAGQI